MENIVKIDTAHQEEIDTIIKKIREYVKTVVGANPITLDVLQKIVHYSKNIAKDCYGVIIGLHFNTERETFDPMGGITMSVNLAFNDNTTQYTCLIGIKPTGN